MAKILKHKFVSVVADGGDATVVRPSNWNDDHNLWLGSRTVTGTTDAIVHADHLSLITYNNAGAVAVSLAAPSGGNMPNGWHVKIRNIGIGAVTITGTGGATINTSASIVLATGNVLELFSLGVADYLAIIPVTRLGNNTLTGTNEFNGQPNTFKGTTTNDAAATGYVGEYVEQVRLIANRVLISSEFYTAVTASPLALTAGDWDVWGQINMVFTGGTIAKYAYLYLSPIAPPANPGSATTNACFRTQDTFIAVASMSESMQVGPGRVSLSAPANYYLTLYMQFNGNCELSGTIAARRIR